MRSNQKKNQLLIVYLVVGFFVGVVYENIVAKTKVVTLDLFFQNNLQLYLETNIVTNKYFVYVLRERFILFLGIALLGYFRWKKLLAVVLSAVTGFLIGVLVILAVLQLGFGGVLLCMACLFPQGLFYGMAAYLVIIYWHSYPKQRWNQIKSVFVLVMLGLGIIVEVYVNPFVVKWMIQVIN